METFSAEEISRYPNIDCCMVISDHSQAGVQLKKEQMGHKKYKKHSLKRKAALPRFVLKEIKILRKADMQ